MVCDVKGKLHVLLLFHWFVEIKDCYIIDEYNLTEISHNGKVYIEIRKGVYGLHKMESLHINY